ncbi:MAG: GntR family transcriptional regulator [Pseudomonadota bacterium]
MADPQAEPFSIALSVLRERLELGRLPPGARITAVDLADELGLSTTPVREALSRLAGEDVVEDRRGQGYFVRRLNAADIADLYRTSLALLLIALDPRRPRRSPPPEGDPAPAVTGDPVSDVEDAFRGWIAATGSRLLIRDFRIVQIRLGPVRRAEADVLGDLSAEAATLLASDALPRPDRLALLRQFHATRIRESERLAGLLEGLGSRSKK